VRCGEIAAAVQRRRIRPALSERALRRQHQIVLRLHEALEAILPVRFGTLVDHAELSRVIELRHNVLLRALRRVRGKVQMTVRVFGSGSPPSRVRLQPASGTDYLKARAVATRGVQPAAAEEVRRAVRSLVADERLDPGRGGVLYSIHHLVSRTRVDNYVSRMNRVVSSASSHVVVSGPWPPFAFAPDLWE
jgi:hypothetical protein